MIEIFRDNGIIVYQQVNRIIKGIQIIYISRFNPVSYTHLDVYKRQVREVVFGVGFALLLPLFFGLDGVLYSMPVSDILTFLVSAAVIRYTYRTLK